MNAARNSRDKLADDYAKERPLISQIVDLALLANGLLRGQQLSDFVARSLKML